MEPAPARSGSLDCTRTLGNERAVLIDLDAYAHRSRGRSRAPAAPRRQRVGRASSDSGRRGDAAYAPRSRLSSPTSLRARENDGEAEARYVRSAEEERFHSDVLAQFLPAQLRARLLARAGDFEAAGACARDAVPIASFTDALREQRADPRRSRRGAAPARETSEPAETTAAARSCCARRAQRRSARHRARTPPHAERREEPSRGLLRLTGRD